MRDNVAYALKIIIFVIMCVLFPLYCLFTADSVNLFGAVMIAIIAFVVYCAIFDGINNLFYGKKNERIEKRLKEKEFESYEKLAKNNNYSKEQYESNLQELKNWQARRSVFTRDNDGSGFRMTPYCIRVHENICRICGLDVNEWWIEVKKSYYE